MDNSNLGLNFTPEVVLWLFLRTHAKCGQTWSKTWLHRRKFRLCTKPNMENLILE